MSPRDSPTHVVVGRLSEHDYISIQSQESTAPRGIVINIENLGGRRSSTPNQYTIQKGTSSTTSTLLKSSAARSSSVDLIQIHNGNHTADVLSKPPIESDTESEYNNSQPMSCSSDRETSVDTSVATTVEPRPIAMQEV